MMKNTFSGLQSKIGDIIKPLPLHPNDLTILSVVLAIIGAYFIFAMNPLGLVFIALSFATDMLDGALARAKNLVSNFGAYLDGITDRLVEFFALLPLFFVPQFLLPSLLVLFFGSVMTAFSKAYADHREVLDAKTASKLKTPLPRAERVIAIFIVLALFLYGYAFQALWLMWSLAAVSIFSFIYLQYAVYKARR